MEKSALAEAAFTGDLALVERLVRDGATVRSVSNDQMSPLHAAIEGGHVEIVALLLAHGADPNEIDSTGFTPLFHAIDLESDAARQLNKPQPSTEILETLLRAGAEVHLKSYPWGNSGGVTPLAIARSYDNAPAQKLLRDAGATH